ncbi:MAG: hypothetical protein L0229_28190 [Blastocatellia bacterium]|nr:hypothetical protein [Blastocatellia bacterium]
MRRVFALVALAALIPLNGYPAESRQQGQTSSSASARSDAKTQAEAKTRQADVTLDAGTRIEAEMSSRLDLEKAKPGDSFKMKTSRPVKRDGKEIISRNSTITGHIEQITRADGSTRATLVFDQLEDKKTKATAMLEATITAVAKANRAAPPDMRRDDARERPPARRNKQSGGLLGGVVDTVGGVTGQAGSTVDATLGTTAGAGSGKGQTGGGLVGSTIQIVTDATATSGSTLALPDRNAKIDSGTSFVLQTTSALTLINRPKEKR